MPKTISPFLWFNGQAEAAVKFYLSIFKGGKILRVLRHGEHGPGPKDSVLLISFKILGQEFAAMNGGQDATFTEAVSFVVPCKTQREVDYYWKKLLAGGGKAQACGWLKDKFGVVWQITPVQLLDLVHSKDRAKSDRAFAAMMKMVKLDIATIVKAANAKPAPAKAKAKTK